MKLQESVRESVKMVNLVLFVAFNKSIIAPARQITKAFNQLKQSSPEFLSVCLYDIAITILLPSKMALPKILFIQAAFANLRQMGQKQGFLHLPTP